MKEKRKNPYQMLMEDIRDYCRKIRFRHTVTMWRYPKDTLKTDQWNLFDLSERVQAADQLGYDVTLEMKHDGLYVLYVKKVPEIPLRW